ncbi:MAG TPA: MBL fold metallo-hydrolase [Thermoleophilaceae bacterium]|jgi:glyoxylase-like metal-dependent hydrolase (beta-lactamase superfamily II)
MPTRDRAPEGVLRLRAPNPSALTLDGTNTYLVEGWVVDPGPDVPEHVDAILSAAEPAGVAGIVLTHSHSDHDEAAGTLAARAGGVEVVRPSEGDRVGPFEALFTPGHSPDHVCLLRDRACFTGDTVLGKGSVFVGSDGGSLADYLDSLHRLRELDIEVICPGHGPFVWNPHERIDLYVQHRLQRELFVLGAIESGATTRDEILERAWADTDLGADPMLRWAAKQALNAHLEKLRDDGRLPPDVPAD